MNRYRHFKKKTAVERLKEIKLPRIPASAARVIIKLVSLVLIPVMVFGSVATYVYGYRMDNPRVPVQAEPVIEVVKPIVQEEAEVLLEAYALDKDIHVSVVNPEGDEQRGVCFEITVENPDGLKLSFLDADKDGDLVIKNMKAGDYVVTLVPCDGYTDAEPVTVTVAEKVEYVKIVDIAEKIQTQDSVNLSNEDSQYGSGTTQQTAPTPPTPTDTVQWVESSVVTEDVTEPTGNKIYHYKPTLDATGQLIDPATQTPTGIYATVDENGYITGGYTLAVPEGGGDPVQTPATVLDANGVPVKKDDGSELYVFETVEEAETAVVQKVKARYGWQTVEGKIYYYDVNGVPVTGWQIIKGVNYYFNAAGVRASCLGVDVSTYQGGSINWSAVKASGVEFVIVRAGFRGYSVGGIVEDSCFRRNVAGASAAGLKVGVYFFSQAVSVTEAVEEASAVLELCRGYTISYPIAIDLENSGGYPHGRADSVSRDLRTQIAIAFCETIHNAGYTPMVYSNKSWFESKLYPAQLPGYAVVWLAHYTPGGATSSYAGRYEIWQYSSTGSVNGIPGNVDMNVSYLGY